MVTTPEEEEVKKEISEYNARDDAIIQAELDQLELEKKKKEQQTPEAEQPDAKPTLAQTWKNTSTTGKFFIIAGAILAVAGLAFAAIGIAAAAGAAGALSIMAVLGGTNTTDTKHTETIETEREIQHDGEYYAELTDENGQVVQRVAIKDDHSLTAPPANNIKPEEIADHNIEQTYNTSTQRLDVTDTITLTDGRGEITTTYELNTDGTLASNPVAVFTDSSGTEHDLDEAASLQIKQDPPTTEIVPETTTRTTITEEQELNAQGIAIASGGGAAAVAGAGMAAAGSNMKKHAPEEKPKSWQERIDEENLEKQNNPSKTL